MGKPEPLVLVFDGYCALCRASTERILSMFGSQIQAVDFRVIPPKQIHPELTEAGCQAQLHVIKDGHVYGGAEAMVKVFGLHGLLRYPVYLYYLPPIGWLTEQIYKVIARNRFTISKWMGNKTECTDACTIHFDKKKTRNSSTKTTVPVNGQGESPGSVSL